jgi:L-asparaginase / beta-aspartyl-peptidase
LAARTVMEHSDHVLLVGEGALAFCREHRPIIGAGTFARNSVCGVSATGHGEMFMRYGVDFEIAARVRHAGLSLHKAARDVIRELRELGGQGGIIAIGGRDAPALLFNTAGMYRGYVLADGKIYTAIWDEPYQEW